MRSLKAVAVIALAVLVAVFVLILCSQQRQGKQQRNAYWPYSVETVIRDR